MDCNEIILSEDYADFIVQNAAVESNDIFIEAACIQPLNEAFRTEYIPLAELYRGQPGGIDAFFLLAGSALRRVDYYSFPKLYGLMDRSALEQSRITDVQNQPALSLSGSGVLIGFVDTGIDWSLPVFRRTSGRTRIVALWDQAGEELDPPDGFYYGTLYQAEELNAALEGMLDVPGDELGHGTFLASVAAGGEDERADFIGAAPEADLAVVKLKQAKSYLRSYFQIPEDVPAYQENDIMAGVMFLQQLAQRRRQPLVLCIGLGSNQGQHAGTSPLAEMLTEIAGLPQRIICACAGNEGGRSSHYYGKLNLGVSRDVVELRVDPMETGFTMEFWAQSTEIYQITLQSPTGETVPKLPGRQGSSQILNFVFEDTVVAVDYEVAEDRSGIFMVQFRFRSPTPGIWQIQVEQRLGTEGEFHMWIPIQDFLRGNTVFLRPWPDVTVTEPGNAVRVLTVGGYQHRDRSIYLNSGRGFNVFGIVKPTMVAPAVEVYGAEPAGFYGYQTGTSIATALMAGACALLLEWAVIRYNSINMNTVEASAYLVRGAQRSVGRAYPNQEWGYGALDLYRTFEVLTII